MILIAGIGNIFLGDDAFGVEVVRRLSSRGLPPNVSVVDFGIRSYDLAYALMEPWKLIILVDALPRGGTPGTLYAMEPELIHAGEASSSFDAHTMNPVSVLQLVSALGGSPGRLLVVGCEPASMEADDFGQIGLSPPVEAAIDEALRMIEQLIADVRKPTAA